MARAKSSATLNNRHSSQTDGEKTLNATAPANCASATPVMKHLQPYRLELVRTGTATLSYRTPVTNTETFTLDIPASARTEALRTMRVVDTRGGIPSLSFESPPSADDEFDSCFLLLENVLARARGEHVEITTSKGVLAGKVVGVHVPTSRRKFNEVATVLLDVDGCVELHPLTEQADISVKFADGVSERVLPPHSKSPCATVEVFADGVGSGEVTISYFFTVREKPTFDITYDCVNGEGDLHDIRTGESTSRVLRCHAMVRNPFPFPLEDVELRLISTGSRMSSPAAGHVYVEQSIERTLYGRRQVEFSSGNSNSSITSGSDSDSDSDDQPSDWIEGLADAPPFIHEISSKVSMDPGKSIRTFLFECSCDVGAVHHTCDNEQSASLSVALKNTSERHLEPGLVTLSWREGDSIQFDIEFLRSGAQFFKEEVARSPISVKKEAWNDDEDIKFSRAFQYSLVTCKVERQKIFVKLDNRGAFTESLDLTFLRFLKDMPGHTAKAISYQNLCDIESEAHGTELSDGSCEQDTQRIYRVMLKPGQKMGVIFSREAETENVLFLSSPLDRFTASNLLRKGVISKDFFDELAAFKEEDRKRSMVKAIQNAHQKRVDSGYRNLEGRQSEELELEMEDGSYEGAGKKAWVKLKEEVSAVREVVEMSRAEYDRLDDEFEEREIRCLDCREKIRKRLAEMNMHKSRPSHDE